MIYQFKRGSRVTGVDAQKVGEALAKMRHRYGMLETETVLRAAKNTRSCMHDAFEWNNKKAGHEFRLWQARSMIHALTVTIEDTDEPVYLHVQTEGVNYYQSTEIACKNVDEFELVRAHALRSLENASQRLEMLERVAMRVKSKHRKKIKSAKQSVDKATQAIAQA